MTRAPGGTPEPTTLPADDIPDDVREDQALVIAIRSGQPEAWHRLIVRYQDRLFSICLRYVGSRGLAEDLTQDAFVKIIQGFDTYDGRARLSTWMIRITMNVCISKLRAEKLRRHASLDNADLGSDSGGRSASWGAGLEQYREPETGLGVKQREERRQLLSALGRLDDQQRAILILRDSRGLDYDQIAEVLGIAVGTVKSRLFRARSALREEIERAIGPLKS